MALSAIMMQMQIRQANEPDYPAIEKMVIESFEPITWFRTIDAKYGPLNGADWRARWQLRMQDVFESQIVLMGEVDGVLAAMSSGTFDAQAALAYIDLLAVSRTEQGHGYGREMLRATMKHMQDMGARYVYLDCLIGNDNANALYESEGFEEVARQIRWFREL
jgi:ribosomal protein S18 acetylase RimI-like enzyme